LAVPGGAAAGGEPVGTAADAAAGGAAVGTACGGVAKP